MANYTNLGVGPGPKKRTPPPPPFGAKKPDMAVVIGVGGPKKPTPGAGPADDEAGETPEFEGQEESGAKLVQAITDAGASVGIHDPVQAKKAAVAFFKAAATSLSDEGPEDPSMSDMGDGAGMEGMG